MTPKCTSWLGHKFEARYSNEPSSVLSGFKADYVDPPTMSKLFTKTTYERDICVRCGHVIEKGAAS